VTQSLFVLPFTLFGTPVYATAELRMAIPSERPVLKHLIVAERAEHSLTDDVIACQIDGVNDGTVSVSLRFINARCAIVRRSGGNGGKGFGTCDSPWLVVGQWATKLTAFAHQS
jgi:hypothetical protein